MIPIQLLGLRHDVTHLSSPASVQRQSVTASSGPRSSPSHAISRPPSLSAAGQQPTDAQIRQSSSSSSGWLRSPTGVRSSMTVTALASPSRRSFLCSSLSLFFHFQTSTSQPFESLKDGISSGMNFLKRRFSTDLEDPAMEAPTTVQASGAPGPPPAGYAAQTTPSGEQGGFSLTGIASKVSATIR